MSSKRRRKAREWMHKQVEAHRGAVRSAVASAVSAARADERNKLTRMIPRDDNGCVYPSGKISSEHVVVPLDPMDRYQRVAMGWREYYEQMSRSYAQALETAHLRARQHALVLQDGTRVIWWGWELAR